MFGEWEFKGLSVAVGASFCQPYCNRIKFKSMSKSSLSNVFDLPSRDFILKRLFRCLSPSSGKLDSFWVVDETVETGVPHSLRTFTHRSTSPWKDKLMGRGQWKNKLITFNLA